MSLSYDHGTMVITTITTLRQETMQKTISKSQFKPKALQYFRELQESGQELVITDHGKPVIKISPYSEESNVVLKELQHSVQRYDSPTEPVALDDWEILK